MSYTIRQGLLEDVPHLPNIERAAGALFTQAGVGGHITVMPTATLTSACRTGRLLVIAHGDCPVGFAVLNIIDGLGHLAEMDVHPDHGRRGLGTALLKACLAWASERALPAMILTTYRDLPWNAPFYARHGFAILPESAWTPVIAGVAAAEGVTPGSGRVVMQCVVPIVAQS